VSKDQPGRSEFRVVVVTSRSAVRALFVDMACQSRVPVVIDTLPLDGRAVADTTAILAAATVAVVDVSVDSTEALEICLELRVHQPTVPIIALACCHHAAAAADLRAFLAAGVGGFLDLRLPEADILRVLRSVARGESIFDLQLSEDSLSALLSAADGGDQLSDQDIELVHLVALGLTDLEIGRRMYLSPHTVKHRIERLRRQTQARNRVQLAAWAGGQAALLRPHTRAGDRPRAEAALRLRARARAEPEDHPRPTRLRPVSAAHVLARTCADPEEQPGASLEGRGAARPNVPKMEFHDCSR
jgi:DNA-binding NarL/FixJ family response regulator